jgi:hypothetical protein
VRVTGSCCVPSSLPLIKQRLRGYPGAVVSPPLFPLSSSGCAGNRRLLCPLLSPHYQAAATRVTGGCCVPSLSPISSSSCAGNRQLLCPLLSPPYQAAAARVTGGCCVPSSLPLIMQRLRRSPVAAVFPPLSPLSSCGCVGNRRLLCSLLSPPYQAAAARVTGGCCVPSSLPLIKQRLRG